MAASCPSPPNPDFWAHSGLHIFSSMGDSGIEACGAGIGRTGAACQQGNGSALRVLLRADGLKAPAARPGRGAMKNQSYA